MLDYTIQIQEGVIQINSVTPLALGDEHAMFDIDCKQKYPEILEASNGVIFLSYSDRTLNLNGRENLSFTEVRFRLPEGNWETAADAGRYSIRVMLIRKPEHDSPDADLLSAAPRYERAGWPD